MTVPDWLSFLLADSSAIQLVFWVLAIVALLVAIVKLWPFMRDAVGIVNALVTLPAMQITVRSMQATVQGMQTQVTSIYHELHPNGGTSVNDSVTRVEKTTERLELGVRGLYDRVADLTAEDARLAAADADLRRDFEDTHGRSIPAGSTRRALREARTAYIPTPPSL